MSCIRIVRRHGVKIGSDVRAPFLECALGRASQSPLQKGDNMSDADLIRRCIALARNAEGRTAPNPMVGAVIVRDGVVLAEGWHEGPGLPHAEIDALKKLGGVAEGATLYVNLEPCC